MNDYLADIDKQVEDMFLRLVKEMADKQGVTEQLKSDNQMEWVRQMNNIRNKANFFIFYTPFIVTNVLTAIHL